MKEKIDRLCRMITEQTQDKLKKSGLGCDANLNNAIARSKDGNKYTKINVGYSGKYMIENSTQTIYGIKAYGQIHRGHSYGTLDTVDQYNWGEYTAVKK